MLRVLALLLGVALAGCVNEPPFDFEAACSTAAAPSTTPADLRRITETIEDASNGDFQPKGEEVERWKAAILLRAAAGEVAAPYALPSEFQGNLPKRPDTTEVRRLQQRLQAACAR